MLPASNTAAQNLLAGTSSNPLDDLVSIFGSGPPAGSSASPMPPQNGAFGGLGGLGGMSPMAASPAPAQQQQQQPQGQQDDLLGLF